LFLLQLGGDRALERQDLTFPAKSHTALAKITELAALMPEIERPSLGRRATTAELPIPRPTCPKCGFALILNSERLHSGVRGDYWRFECRDCKGRFWSNDGCAHLVNPSGLNTKDFTDRVNCPSCNLPCRVSNSPGKRNREHRWECRQCHTKYRNVEGQPQPVQPGRRCFKCVPFLADRKCPNCSTERLCIKNRPPSTPVWYFRCGNCKCQFIWDVEQKKLIPRLVKRRSYRRRKRGGSSISEDTKLRIDMAAACKVLGMGMRKSAPHVYPDRYRKETALSATKALLKRYKDAISVAAQKLPPEKASELINSNPLRHGPSPGYNE
jgi:rubredoxin